MITKEELSELSYKVNLSNAFVGASVSLISELVV